MVENYGTYDLILLVDSNGKVFASNSMDSSGNAINISKLHGYDLSEEEWYSKTMNHGNYMTDWRYSPLLEQVYSERRPSVQISSVIKALDDKNAGVMVAFLSWDKIQRIVDKVKDTYFGPSIESGYSYLIKGDGDTIIAHSDKNLYGRSISRDLNIKDVGNLSASKNNVKQYKYNGVVKTATCTNPADNSLGWMLCSSVTNSDLYSNIFKLKIALIIIVTFTTFAAIFFSMKYSHKIVKPILALKEKTKIISDGNYDISQPISADNELKDLDDSFNTMIESIKMYQKESEKNTKLAAIGQSASAIAHDIRKPLTSMKSLLSILPEKQHDEVFIKSMVTSVENTINRANSMLSDILEFSKDATALERKPHNLQSIITASLSDVFRSYDDADIRIEYYLEHRNYVNVDGDRIIRVFTNIIVNAVEAMQCKGKLWFRTRDILGDDDKIEIVIGNDGPVIPEDVQMKLFDPFFTKGKKGGTGLGLSICQKIIDLHGGRLTLTSHQPRMTEFIIDLPASEGNLVINESELIHHTDELNIFREEESNRMITADSENISDFLNLHKKHGKSLYMLIVDDEPLFRETIRSLLKSATEIRDYVRIIESGSAEEALNLFNARKFDYVVADIDLGKNKMNGYEFSERILKEHPDVHVLIHSNKRRVEMDKGIRNIENSHFMGFLPKPMNRSQLVQFLACKTFETIELKNTGTQKIKNVLVLNDDDALLLSFRVMLKSPKIKVYGATTVDDAMETLTKEKIDIVLSDINLGDGEPDGYEFLSRVREMDQEIPFYMVSGYSRSEEEHKAKSRGANGYIQLLLEKDQLDEVLS